MVIHSFSTVVNKADKVPAKRELWVWGYKGDEAAEEVGQNLRVWLLSQTLLRKVCCWRLSRIWAPFLVPSPLLPHPSVSDSHLVLCPGITQAIKIEAGIRTPACSWWGKLKLSLHIKICANKILGGPLFWNPKDEALKLASNFFFPFQFIPIILTTWLRICAACAYHPLHEHIEMNG